MYRYILGAAPHKGLLTLYWELPLTRGYWLYTGSCPSRGDTDSLWGAAPHKGLLTLYWELPLTRGYWLYTGSCPSRGDTDSLWGAAPHKGLLTLYWELPLTRGYWLYTGSCPSRGATDSMGSCPSQLPLQHCKSIIKIKHTNKCKIHAKFREDRTLNKISFPFWHFPFIIFDTAPIQLLGPSQHLKYVERPDKEVRDALQKWAIFLPLMFWASMLRWIWPI